MIEPTVKVTIWLDQWGAPLQGSIEVKHPAGPAEIVTQGLEPDSKPVSCFRRLANEGLALVHQNDALSRIFKL